MHFDVRSSSELEIVAPVSRFCVAASISDKSKIPKLLVDPDDPWAETINPPVGVYKVHIDGGEVFPRQSIPYRLHVHLWCMPIAFTVRRILCGSQEKCPITGYLLTKPFEAICPMPEVFASDCKWLDGERPARPYACPALYHISLPARLFSLIRTPSAAGMLAPVIKPKGENAAKAAAKAAAAAKADAPPKAKVCAFLRDGQ